MSRDPMTLRGGHQGRETPANYVAPGGLMLGIKVRDGAPYNYGYDAPRPSGVHEMSRFQQVPTKNGMDPSRSATVFRGVLDRKV